MSISSKNAAMFALGTLFGTVGIKILTSKDARKVYTHATAAGLRARDSVMETVTLAQENWGDILADAQQINEDRAAAEAAAAEAAEAEAVTAEDAADESAEA